MRHNITVEKNMRIRQRVSLSLSPELLKELESIKGEHVPMSRVVENTLWKGLNHAEQ
jgi:hypothetical protein